MNKISIGKKLQNLRNAFYLTQAQFGEKLGVSKYSITSYENNINPLPVGIKWKIAEIIGIGADYFDTDMDLATALAKYNVDVNKEIEVKAHNECICTIFDSLDDFANNKSSVKPYTMQMEVLNKIFNLSKPHEYNFIIAKDKKAEPFAEDGQVLVVVRDSEPKDRYLNILRINNEIMIKQCRINHKTLQIKLVSNKDDFGDFDLKFDEFKDVEFLGYVLNIFKNA